MKKITYFILTIFAVNSGFSQHVHNDQPEVGPNWCGHYHQQQKIYADHPEYRMQDSIDQAAFQRFYEDFLPTWSQGERTQYIIPVVVHIVHLGGPENIEDEQVFSALEKLNEDYSGTNPDLGNTVPDFTSVIGFPDIEFRLATKDPSGECHSGITRTYSSTSYDDGSGAIIDAVAAQHGVWPQNKYMNVFVCLDPNGAAGYTQYPSSWYPETSMYGSIMMRHDYMGVIGTSSSVARHTLSHEAGHWLNLRHCWGNSNSPGDSGNCSTDDQVSDTPNTIGWTACIVDGESCGNLDNVQNIMEYSYCSTMFTQGQAARMIAALNSGTAGRNNLWTPSNLAATGVDGPGDICEADFSSDYRIVCAGSTIQFYDNSYHNVTGRTWTFDGGTPGSSTVQDPSVTFNTPGVYNVSLEVTDGSSTITKTANEYVVVLGEPGAVGVPYHEGFEYQVSFPDNQSFMVENPDEAASWQRISGIGSSGYYSVKLNNYGVNNGSTDAFLSGTIDLSSIDPADNVIFTFEYAYKRKVSNNNEALKFYISKDCGETWVLRKNVSGTNLSDVNSSSAYTPSGQDEWVEVQVLNINSEYYVSNFRYKFEFTNDGGNNIYIDNINLYPESMTTISENDDKGNLTVYPNPVSNELNISLSGFDGEEYTIELYNALGQKVETIYSGVISGVNNTIQYNTSNLEKGVYLIYLRGEGRVETVKLIKE